MPTLRIDMDDATRKRRTLAEYRRSLNTRKKAFTRLAGAGRSAADALPPADPVDMGFEVTRKGAVVLRGAVMTSAEKRLMFECPGVDVPRETPYVRVALERLIACALIGADSKVFGSDGVLVATVGGILRDW